MSAVEAATELTRLLDRHHHYRADSLNLCVSEAVTSRPVREVLGSDLSRRYWSETGDYAGGRDIEAIERIAAQLARELFGAAFANVYPVSGHVSLLAALYACTEPGATVMLIPDDGGGYTAAGFTEKSGLIVEYLPFDPDGFVVPASEAADAVRRVRPQAVVLGSSTCPFAHPVAAVAAACREVGARLIYDASHVLGLIAGGQYQDPLGDGADVMVGSTNKTFPGPHRGLILTNDEQLHRRMVEIVLPAPYLQSSHHAGTAGALAFALAEMLAFGRDYAAQVVRNSRALAAALDDRGVPLLGGVATSDSHQVVIDLGGLASPAAVELCASLEAANVFADVVVRLGTQQPARLGMGEGEMVEIADIVAGTMKQGATDALRERSRTLAMSYRTLSFAFDLGEPDDAYRQLGPGVPSLSP